MDVSALFYILTFHMKTAFVHARRLGGRGRPGKDPPTETLVNVLKLILKCNNFEFKGKHYPSKSKAQPWEQKWLQLMHISSWNGWKDNFLDQVV